MENEKRPDLIDRSSLGIGKAKREVFDNPAYADGWNSAIAIIENAPTVDAVEVVHAHWDNNGICTLCGYPIPTDSKYDFIDKDDCLFCYHCGAKMYGGNENGVDD